MLHVVCNIRPSIHSAYRHSEIQASVVALYAKLQHIEPTTSQGLVRYIAGEAEALIHHIGLYFRYPKIKSLIFNLLFGGDPG
jgi:hypothetical protein